MDDSIRQQVQDKVTSALYAGKDEAEKTVMGGELFLHTPNNGEKKRTALVSGKKKTQPGNSDHRFISGFRPAP